MCVCIHVPEIPLPTCSSSSSSSSNRQTVGSHVLAPMVDSLHHNTGEMLSGLVGMPPLLRGPQTKVYPTCLYLQHIFKDQPWLLRESGETGFAIQNSHAYCLIVPSVISTRTFTEVTQTALTWQLHKPSLS